MTIVIILLAIGVLLLAGEIFLPSLVLGLLGIIALIAGTSSAFWSFGPVFGSVTAVVSMILIILTFWLEFGVFPTSRLAKALSITEKSGPNQLPVADRTAVVGRTCTALTAMAPSGFVEFDGRQYDARCRDGHAKQGELLKIADVNSFQLIVTKTINTV